MKRHVLIKTILIIIILCISYWNILQHQENVILRELVVTQEEKQKELKQIQEELLKEAAASSKALKKVKEKATNKGEYEKLISEYSFVVTKLFESNLNFTPTNYDKRKQEVSSYLSDELNNEYFGQKRDTYQDSNGTTSQLETIEIFTKGLKENDFEGLVIVHFKSKIKEDSKWNNMMNIFEVVYNKETRKIVKILNLGAGYFRS